MRISKVALNTVASRATHASQLSSIFSKHRTGRPVNIINPNLCNLAVKKADLSAYTSKNPILIDVNPGACVWSAALHDLLKPRSHILLEPEARYAPILNDFTKTRPNAYWVPLDGYHWATYVKLFKPNPPRPPWPVDRDFPDFDPKFVPPEDGVNLDIIFTGNLSISNIKGERLLAQFLKCTSFGLWVQKFGRVRFLIWAQDVIKERYLPRGIGGRGRPAVLAETLCAVREIASSPLLRTGKGRPRPSDVEIDEQGNAVITTPEAQKQRIGRPPAKGKESEGLNKPRKLMMSIGEIGEIFDRIEVAHGDLAAVASLEEELLANGTISKRAAREKAAKNKAPEKASEAAAPKRGPGRPRKSPPEPKESRRLRKSPPEPKESRRLRINGRRALLIPELERIRGKLILFAKKSREEGNGVAIAGLMSKICQKDRALSRQKQRMITNLEAFLKSGDERWVTGMEHPPWWYRDCPERIDSLAETLIKQRTQERTGFEKHIQIAEEETVKGIKALEGLEETEDREDREKNAAYEDFEEQWGKKADLTWENSDDDLLAFKKKLLQWQNRPFDPLPVEDKDFWPPNPLTLLDFTPILTDEFFRPADLAERDHHWEVYIWFLRGLLGLRAHTIAAALNSIVPGGKQILAEVDEVAAGGKIDPKERVRTLSVKQLVEITKAWNKWPFRNESACWDDADDIMPDAGGPKRWGM